ncbi:hypothetical protein CHU98_g8391 [Xylaria longipes]|nr:hypothetical protein CHU98_g8391 [Xylaria longipes]
MYTMARLNEPPVSTDSLEILRRKFLRQNRDIARTNSTQSLKIRNLENECARLLSENLQLRSEVLRLKSDLEGSHARRVADHALQIKEKMEAQLVEWGAMLASLGHEPVPKNRSPRALKKARIQRDSIGHTRISDWRRRETMSSMQNLEAAALQEGRLPPLWENKTYPRETLNTDSPDLGPPPVSRFVDEDPVKFDLPTLTKLLKPALGESENNSLEDTCKKPMLLPGSPTTSTKIQDVIKEEPKHQRTESAEESDSQTITQAAKANLKRKIREDEKENAPLSKPPQLAGTVTKSQPEKVMSEKSKPTNRLMKELPLHKRDSREKSSHTTQRKPLGAKSSNEALGSPMKSAKAPVEGKGAKPKAKGKGEEQAKDHLKHQQEAKLVEIPPPGSPEPVTHVDIEPESLSAEPNLAVPDTPEPSAQREEMNDTPPPVDISSKGETTRGNRRARAAVSYAEPNLRDKMRRPNTKQLFDAVAGEGKNVRRTSQCQKDEPSSVPSSVAKSGVQSESTRKDASSSQRVSNDVCPEVDIMASPLVQKTTRTSAIEGLPPSVTTDRKKKDSLTATQDREDYTATTAKPLMKGANRRLEKIAAREAEVAKFFDNDESDVYTFTESSPTDVSSKESTPEEKSSRTTKSGRQQRSRRLSSMAREDLQPDDSNPSKLTGSRKRASMATIKSTKSDLENESFSSVDGDSSVSTVEGGEATMTTRKKTTNTRRRTTMI